MNPRKEVIYHTGAIAPWRGSRGKPDIVERVEPLRTNDVDW
jgi:hypothetical protein